MTRASQEYKDSLSCKPAQTVRNSAAKWMELSISPQRKAPASELRKLAMDQLGGRHVIDPKREIRAILSEWGRDLREDKSRKGDGDFVSAMLRQSDHLVLPNEDLCTLLFVSLEISLPSPDSEFDGYDNNEETDDMTVQDFIQEDRESSQQGRRSPIPTSTSNTNRSLNQPFFPAKGHLQEIRCSEEGPCYGGSPSFATSAEFFVGSTGVVNFDEDDIRREIIRTFCISC